MRTTIELCWTCLLIVVVRLVVTILHAGHQVHLIAHPNVSFVYSSKFKMSKRDSRSRSSEEIEWLPDPDVEFLAARNAACSSTQQDDDCVIVGVIQNTTKPHSHSHTVNRAPQRSRFVVDSFCIEKPRGVHFFYMQILTLSVGEVPGFASQIEELLTLSVLEL